MFYTEFFKNQYSWLIVFGQEDFDVLESCRIGLCYCNMMMQINEESIFKIAIEFYHFLLGKHLQER